MEFLCDQCGTKYETAQAVREDRAYQYKCGVCRNTILIRAATYTRRRGLDQGRGGAPRGFAGARIAPERRDGAALVAHASGAAPLAGAAGGAGQKNGASHVAHPTNGVGRAPVHENGVHASASAGADHVRNGVANGVAHGGAAGLGIGPVDGHGLRNGVAHPPAPTNGVAHAPAPTNGVAHAPAGEEGAVHAPGPAGAASAAGREASAPTGLAEGAAHDGAAPLQLDPVGMAAEDVGPARPPSRKRAEGGGKLSAAARDGLLGPFARTAAEGPTSRESAPRTPAALDAPPTTSPRDAAPRKRAAVDLRYADDPPTPPDRCLDLSFVANLGAKTAPAPAITPASVAPSAPARTPFRPADGPNRDARAEATHSSVIHRLGARLRRAPPAHLAGGLRAPRRLGKAQRLAAALGVFVAVTGLAVIIGVALERTATDRSGASATSGAELLPPPVARAIPFESLTAERQPPAAPAREEARRAPQGRTSDPPSPPPAATAAPAAPAAPAATAATAATAHESVPAPAPRYVAPRSARPEPLAAPEPPRLAARTEPPRREDAAPIASPPEAAPVPLPPSIPRQRPASQEPPAARDEEPVVARAGYRLPAPVTPRCVEKSARLPAPVADRMPGSVILRFAVGRDGAADLVQMQPGPDRLPGERVEPEIVEALTAAVKGCRFTPGLDDHGRPARMWVVSKVQFR